MKLIQKLSEERLIGIQCCILVIIQPLLDIYRSFIGNQFELFGISLVELFNFILIAYLFLLTLCNKTLRKNVKYIFVFLALFGVYFVLHTYNIYQFDTSILTGSTQSWFTELYFITRSYLFPLLLLYVLLNIKIDKNLILRTVTISALFISFIIIFTNIFKVSLVSYASDLPANTMISHNIFEWFDLPSNVNVSLLTSKGWFYSGNQIGIILFMLYPIVLYSLISKYRHKIDYLCAVLLPIAMVMIGTKTASIGSLIIILATMILYVLFRYIFKHYKLNIYVVATLFIGFLLSTVLILNSPVMQNVLGSPNVSAQESEDIQKELDKLPKDHASIDAKELSNLINKYHNAFGIHGDYVALYPVEKNTNFWFDVVVDPSQAQLNFRKFKMRIFDEVIIDNNQILDRWVGIGYVSNFPYVESDINSQNVWFGFTGTLLFVGPFYMILVYAAFRILKNFKKLLNLESCMVGMAICAGLSISYLAGHLFGFMFPIIYLCLLESFLLQETYEGE